MPGTINAPTTYTDLVYASPQIEKLVEAIVKGTLPFPANGKNGLILYGPNGTGKTTLAKLLPQDMHVHRPNNPTFFVSQHTVMSGSNGPALIQTLHNQASNFYAGYDHNCIILDEVDHLGHAAMLSLKAVMNVPMTLFIMTTNNLPAIERGVVSRSILIQMTPPPPVEFLPLARRVLISMGITKKVADAVLLPIITKCNGDVREVISQMTQAALNI
jgi:replication-associated recombination protein RarA